MQTDTGKKGNLIGRPRHEVNLPLRVAIPYLVFASLWILLSDRLVFILTPDLQRFWLFGTIKGILFVLVSGTLLWWLLDREMKRRRVIEKERSELLAREQAARARFETASRAKDELLSLVSHELRTPLMAILTSTELLGYQKGLTEDQRELLDEIRQGVLEESRIISELLDATTLSSGSMDLNLQSLDIHLLVKLLVDELSDSAAFAGQKIDINCAEGMALIQGDYQRLKQALAVILGNALKFTPADGRITLSTRLDRGAVLLDVIDTGVGLPPEFEQRMFGAFEPGDKSTTRSHGGLGLGLFISRSIIELHGGIIQAKRSADGVGSHFTVILPLAEPAIDRETNPDTSPKAGNERVLLVEDNIDTLKAMARLLGKDGWSVLAARSAEEAMTVLKDQPVDLIISVIGLPDQNGWDLMKTLRPNVAVPAIAISGFYTEDDRQKSLEAGFTAHLVKPISFSVLKNTIDQLTSRKTRQTPANSTAGKAV